MSSRFAQSNKKLITDANAKYEKEDTEEDKIREKFT